jgi:hypothetical protein
MLAIAPELTMADPEAQSDEMDIVSIDSDRAEHGAADAAGVVCPLRVQSSGENAAQTWLPKPPPRGIGGSRSQHLLQNSDRGL